MEKLECFSRYVEENKFGPHCIPSMVLEVKMVFNLIATVLKCPSPEKWIQGTCYICEVEYWFVIEMNKVTCCIDQPWTHYGKWKNMVVKMMYDSIYKKYREINIYSWKIDQRPLRDRRLVMTTNGRNFIWWWQMLQNYNSGCTRWLV